jgi:uncharacterized protein involved in exopolysaccharide biosynthesis
VTETVKHHDDVDEDVIDLRPYAIAVLRHWLVIVLGALAGGVIAFALVSRSVPVYEAHAQMFVLVPKKAVDPAFQTASILNFASLIFDNQELAASVIADMGLDRPPHRLSPSDFYARCVSVSRVGGSNVIAVSARLSDAALSVKTANQFCVRAVEVAKRINEEEVLILKPQLDRAEERLREAQATLTSTLGQRGTQATAKAGGEIDLAKARTDYDVAERIYAEVATRYERVQLAVLVQGAQLQVTSRAESASQVSPRRSRATAAGAFVGFVLALIGVVLWQAARGSRAPRAGQPRAGAPGPTSA